MATNGKTNGAPGGERPRLSDRGPHLRRRGGRRRRRGPARGASAAPRPDLRTACITKVFPTRSHTVAAQGGIAAALGNMGEDDWRWHMYDTVKGSDWLGDQDAIEYHVPQRAGRRLRARAFRRAVLAHARRRQDLSAPVRRHDHALRQGHRAAHLRRRRPHRPRHAAHAVRPGAAARRRILHRIFRARPDHGRRGPLPRRDRAGSSTTARSIASARRRPCSRPAAMAAPISPAPRAHTCTGDGNAMVLRAGLPLQDMEFVQFHPTGIYGAGCLITEGARGEGGYLDQFRGRALHGALCAVTPRTSPRATSSRAR